MALAFYCPDCQRTYPYYRVRGDPDTHGSMPLQCPNCYNYLGRTAQGEA